MTNRLSKAPASRRTPGVPGVPPSPAFCVDEPVFADYGTVSNLQRIADLTRYKTGRAIGQVYYRYVDNQMAVAIQSIDPELTKMFTGAAIGSSAFVAYYLRKCYPSSPGKPAIPPKITYSAKPGWDSGGLSQAGFAVDGYVEFKIGPASIGVIVGINTGSDTVSPGDCSHAFYGRTGSLDIFESGTLVMSVPGGLAGLPVLRIARSNGVVRYLVNGEVIYTSLKPSSGYARLDASLYMAGDYVDSPLLGSFISGAAVGYAGVTAFIDRRARAIGRAGVSGHAQGRAGDALYAAASGAAGIKVSAAGFSYHHAMAMAALGVTGSATPPANKAHGIARAAVGLAADADYAIGAAVYRGGYIGQASGGFPEVEFSYGAAYAPKALSFGYGPSGGVATASGTAAAAQGAAGEDGYAFGNAIYKGRYFSSAYAPWLDASSFHLNEQIIAQDSFHLSAEAFATFISAIDIVDGLLLEIEVRDGLEWFDSILTNSSFAENGERYAEFSDQVAITTQTNIPKLEGIQYATNIQTGAITRYSGFDFLAIASTPYGAIGVRDDGVYRIGRGDDDGDGIDLMVDFGANEFGTNLSKRVESVYFGLTTDGQVLAVLKADDGKEQSYTVEKREPMMRAVTAKGVTGKAWRLCLKVYEASQAELDSVELSVGVTTRRLR